MGKEFQVFARLFEAQRRFNRACDQIVLLNCKLRDVTTQTNKLNEDKAMKKHLYSLRMRILVLEGMMGVFVRYADKKRDEVYKLREELIKLQNSKSESIQDDNSSSEYNDQSYSDYDDESSSEVTDSEEYL